MCMNNERLPLRLLSNEWNKVKSKGHHRNSCLAQVTSLKKGLDFQDKAFNVKIIKGLAKRECDEFEICLQHKSEVWVYREVKREVGFEEYFEHINGAHSRYIFKVCSGTHGF